MQVIIPVAGVGKRIRPHTHTKAKPLLHVAGKAVIDHIMDDVKKIKPSEVIFITGHLGGQMKDHIKTKYAEVKSTFIEQPVMDGTAGAIKLAKDRIKEPLLIIFADTLSDADYTITLKSKDEGIFWAKEVEDYSRFGVIITDENDYMVRIVEKPDTPVSKLANIGLYYIRDYKLMYECIDEIYKKDMKTKGEYYLTDAFQLMVDKGAKIKIVGIEGWYDCGKPETLLETNRTLLDQGKTHEIKTKNSVLVGPVYIENGVVIEDSVIGPYVSIAKGSIIRKSIIENSIIDEDAEIFQAQLRKSLIAKNAHITGVFKALNIGADSEVSLGDADKT
ncbi:nucleotidyltransferase [Candidatus Woesearchaeota archaeon]|nr:nucleotidyltransferase [Candidatus Woesearchaeota archaeon]